MNRLTFLLLAVAVASLTACTPRARIRGADEESLVGDRRAGAAVYRTVIDQALIELSTKYRAQIRNDLDQSRIKVAFMGIDNRTNEELGAWRDQINDIINSALNESGDFLDISFEYYVVPALRRASVNKEDLVLPADYRRFAEVLEASGRPLDALLYGRLSQGDTRSGNLTQSDYLLTFELMNPLNGTRLNATGELSKEYAR